MKKLLLLHGAIGSKAQLEPISEILKDNFELHKLNFSGHGGRDFNPHFNIKQFAEDVIEYLTENKIQSVDVFGYSMGGYVALYLARHYPKRVGKIITLGTKFKWNENIANKEVKMLNPDVISEKIPVFANVLNKRHSPIDWKILLAKTSDMMLEMGLHNPLQINDYNQINHEVKIGLAIEDEMVSKEETEKVYENLPNAVLYFLPNSKHPIEKVDLRLLTKEILNFMN